MEDLFHNLLRQLILYSLPVLISLSLLSLAEGWRRPELQSTHSFAYLGWSGTWLPLLASILLHRGMIIVPPRIFLPGPVGAVRRLLVHLLLCGVGFGLYSLALHYAPPTGLPPLHLWWAKVLMFFNLCMAAMHLLPLPGFAVGELFCRHPRTARYFNIGEKPLVWWLTLLAASPLLDMIPGRFLSFPVYEYLASAATRF